MHGIWHILTSALNGVVRGVYDSYRLGGRTLVVAPALVAIAAIPEFAQHVAEITMGMFDSRAAAADIANSSLRWGFGYVKIAGLVAAILLTIRFWAKGSLRDTVRIAPLKALKLLLIAVATPLSGGAIDMLGAWIWPAGDPLFTAIATVVQFGILVWLIGSLVDDPAISLWRAFRSRLPTAALLLILSLSVFVPGQALHGIAHRLALGQARPMIWMLMVFDSMVVGTMAVTVGCAFYVGYRSGASWRGWAPLASGRDEATLPR